MAAIAPVAGDSYLCDDGSILSVDIQEAGGSRVAKVAMSTGETLSLAEVESTFAERYSAGTDTLRLSGGILLMTRGSSRQFCEAQ